MLRAKDERNTYNLQQPQTNNNQINVIPLKTVPRKDNIINNRLLLNPAKKIIVDPQNKKQIMKSQPVDPIYKDQVSNVNLTNYNYSNVYNPYIDLNRPYNYLKDPKKDQEQHKYFQSPYQRYPYWQPLWMQYHKMHDLAVLIPISNDLDLLKSNKVESSEKGRKYAPFIFPVPIVVKKKKEKITESFRPSRNFSQSIRINRVNHSRGPSRAISTSRINVPSRTMQFIRNHNNKTNMMKPMKTGDKYVGNHRRHNNNHNSYCICNY